MVIEDAVFDTRFLEAKNGLGAFRTLAYAFYLFGESTFTIRQLAKHMDRDMSVVYRYLQTLKELGYIIEDTSGLEYIYKVNR